MSSQDEHDPFVELLSGIELPPVDLERREAIFTKTRGTLRRRRIVRRCLWTGALAACYVVGVLSVLGWQSINPRMDVAVQPINNGTNASETAPAQHTSPQTTPAIESNDQTQSTVVQSAPEETLTTFEKMRRAGDRQLNVRNNLQGAIGCYRRALDFATDDELRIVPDRDSWLLISLKENRVEERKHGRKKI